jgi:histidine ammonia-lyase
MGRNAAAIVAIELLAAAQGVDFRRPLKTSPALARAHAALRRRVPFLDRDRPPAPDIAAVQAMVASGGFRDFLPGGLLPSAPV